MEIGGVEVTLIFLIFVALAFDFLNGLHDAANSIATIVSTRALKPHQAVIWAAFFNVVAYFFFGIAVAKTVGSGIIAPTLIDDAVIFGALSGAIVWNVVTWLAGIPSSSSHALVGGIVGAGVAKGGFDAIVWSGLSKTLYAIVGSPMSGVVLAMLFMLIMSWLFVRATPAFADSLSRRLQFLSAAAYSIGHGGNDAQKTMGIIAALLYSHGIIDKFEVPFWAAMLCYTAMGLGTAFGGWRIVHTMGSKITRLSPMQGFVASAAGAVTLFAATNLGIPVSTTHTITGAIVGTGVARRVSAVRWGIARGIVVAWVITMPAAAIIAAVAYWFGTLIF
jgi:inorganic phosphate transporter, PiT family